MTIVDELKEMITNRGGSTKGITDIKDAVKVLKGVEGGSSDSSFVHIETFDLLPETDVHEITELIPEQEGVYCFNARIPEENSQTLAVKLAEWKEALEYPNCVLVFSGGTSVIAPPMTIGDTGLVIDGISYNRMMQPASDQTPSLLFYEDEEADAITRMLVYGGMVTGEALEMLQTTSISFKTVDIDPAFVAVIAGIVNNK